MGLPEWRAGQGEVKKSLCLAREMRGKGKKAVSKDEPKLRVVLRDETDSPGRNGGKGNTSRQQETWPQMKRAQK